MFFWHFTIHVFSAFKLNSDSQTKVAVATTHHFNAKRLDLAEGAQAVYVVLWK